MNRRQWGWAGTVEEFLQADPDVWLSALAEHLLGLMNLNPSGSQVEAWREEFGIVRSSLRDVCVAEPAATRWGIVFEYELPLEGGRRPDVVVLAGGAIVVLEFKQSPVAQQSARDQVEAYARDLAEYHAATHGLMPAPVVVLTHGRPTVDPDEVQVITPDGLAGVLLWHARPGSIDLDTWLNSEYAPLPILIAAARRIFQHEPLPAVRSALSSSIPEAVELLGRLAEDAAANSSRTLAFVAGVPGSGKTLAGLCLVYERASTMSAATFLSGNGPLVEVLRDALKSGALVKDLHAFIKTYGLSNKVPREHVIVFDEAQRAWDAGYMQYKHAVDKSEPDLLIDIGERLPDWAALVGLVGDGQEIHAGEEAGMDQWAEAVDPARGRKEWAVHCPPRMVDHFPQVPTVAHEALDLTISLRSRRADHLHDWVAALLAGRLGDAARLAAQVQAAMFPMYLTRDLDDARVYVWNRYEGEIEKRYGLLGSSRAGNYLAKHGADASWVTSKKVKIARWFNEPRGHPQSCCELTDVITEFQCQGLEVDMPIVAWGNDMTWDGRAWRYRLVRPRYPLEDPDQLRRNSYRVLLTRGRDGLVIFVPPDPALDTTEHALLAAGIRPLETELVNVRAAAVQL